MVPSHPAPLLTTRHLALHTLSFTLLTVTHRLIDLLTSPSSPITPSFIPIPSRTTSITDIGSRAALLSSALKISTTTTTAIQSLESIISAPFNATSLSSQASSGSSSFSSFPRSRNRENISVLDDDIWECLLGYIKDRVRHLEKLLARVERGGWREGELVGIRRRGRERRLRRVVPGERRDGNGTIAREGVTLPRRETEDTPEQVEPRSKEVRRECWVFGRVEIAPRRREVC
ncbi:hypothetical protein BZA77DRAFT_353954 [Pyronema omphalodes]|nr:hypothetical protein BZA77DRAFT_353954 [Pyronema omphalodes]